MRFSFIMGCMARFHWLLPIVGVLSAVLALSQSVSRPLAGAFQWRGIGPAATGGRIADLAVVKPPGEAQQIYVATTTGGVFKSVNAGVSFAPIFDRSGGMMSIGAVAVSSSNPSVVWVGTGEADNRQSSSWGDGVYRSTDGGRTWQKMGLDETRHIGKIVIDPRDPNIVYVAAVGHLWGSNPDRGVFKTTDGGKTWNKVLYRDANTGAIDLAMDPHNPEVIFATLYQRQRKGWGFNGGGPGSGIFRTSDGGANWTELTAGLPRGDKGRIGLAIFPGDTQVVYAIVEADAGAGFAETGTGFAGRGNPSLRMASSQNGGVFRSIDQGQSWEHMTSLNPRPSYYSRIYVDPKAANRLYIMGSNRGFYVSDDSGHNFHDVFSGVHGEDHVMWIDPDDTNHLAIGGDGGVSISFDRGNTWLFRLNLPIGQFYNISANNADPFVVCGGLQDNGSWCTPSATNIGYGISFKDAFNIGGGDGMQAIFDGDDRTLLVSSQNGSTYRLYLDSMERQQIAPVQPPGRAGPGRPTYRWYWTSPLIVSHHSPNTIYTGANVLFRSDDRGVSWKAISPDLTAAVDREKLQMMGAPIPASALSRNDGQSSFSALTVIADSPLDPNLLYTGADDGTIQRTRDGGKHWTDLTPTPPGLPPMLNISGMAASRFAAGRVYLTVDGHFNDDYHPYVFASEDYGQTWRAIVDGLPQSSVHRLRESPGNPDFLVAGLETGVYASFDRGAHWSPLGDGLPPVPVYDLVFQERDHALVAGTHGRGIWVLDHVEPLAEFNPQAPSARFFSVAPAYRKVIYPGQFWFGAGEFFAPNPTSGAILTWYLPEPGAVTVTISDAAGRAIRTMRGSSVKGMNRACWDLRRDAAVSTGAGPLTTACDGISAGGGPVVLPGKYTARLAREGAAPLETAVTVLPDPHFQVTPADRAKRNAAITAAYTLQQQMMPARDAVQGAGMRISSLRSNPAAARQTVDALASQLAAADRQIVGVLSAAARVQNAMDAFAGVPTAAQLRDLDFLWEDATAAVAALNHVIGQDLPAAYAAAPGMAMAEMKPVPAPVRRR
jgi:photosystem II stability/assembly factor-like uncharacterized protein